MAPTEVDLFPTLREDLDVHIHYFERYFVIARTIASLNC